MVGRTRTAMRQIATDKKDSLITVERVIDGPFLRQGGDQGNFVGELDSLTDWIDVRVRSWSRELRDGGRSTSE